MNTCDIRCQTADTPEDECECSCGGEYHGGQPPLDEFHNDDDSADSDDSGYDVHEPAPDAVDDIISEFIGNNDDELPVPENTGDNE